VVGGLY
jgi:hypothetical protein